MVGGQQLSQNIFGWVSATILNISSDILAMIRWVGYLSGQIGYIDIWLYTIAAMSLKLNISINEIHEVKICLNFIRPPCIYTICQLGYILFVTGLFATGHFVTDIS